MEEKTNLFTHTRTMNIYNINASGIKRENT